MSPSRVRPRARARRSAHARARIRGLRRDRACPPSGGLVGSVASEHGAPRTSDSWDGRRAVFLKKTIGLPPSWVAAACAAFGVAVAECSARWIHPQSCGDVVHGDRAQERCSSVVDRRGPIRALRPGARLASAWRESRCSRTPRSRRSSASRRRPSARWTATRATLVRSSAFCSAGAECGPHSVACQDLEDTGRSTRPASFARGETAPRFLLDERRSPAGPHAGLACPTPPGRALTPSWAHRPPRADDPGVTGARPRSPRRPLPCATPRPPVPSRPSIADHRDPTRL